MEGSLWTKSLLAHTFLLSCISALVALVASLVSWSGLRGFEGGGWRSEGVGGGWRGVGGGLEGVNVRSLSLWPFL